MTIRLARASAGTGNEGGSKVAELGDLPQERRSLIF
jgi:hypothetical protein